MKFSSILLLIKARLKFFKINIIDKIKRNGNANALILTTDPSGKNIEGYRIL